MDTARELTKHLADLLGRERSALAEFLLALASFDERRLWADPGHANLFSFLHRELGLSRGAAHYRKTASELVRSYPEVVEPLRDGRLCITSVVELAKAITPENRREVVPRFFHLSKREAQEISAELCPRAAPVRDVVTAAPRALREDVPQHPADGAGAPPDLLAPCRAPAAPASEAQRDGLPVVGNAPRTDVSSDLPFNRLNSPRANSPSQVEPLDRELRRLHVTVSRRFLAKLEAARDALSHAKPNATTEELLEAGLDLLLAQRAKRHGLVSKPRNVARPAAANEAAAPSSPAKVASSAPANAPPGRAIPAHVKREVFERAGRRCEWRLHSGERCGSTVRLQYDHVVPHARGGPSTLANVRLLCASHNDLAARQVFGDAWMDRFRRNASARSETPALHADDGDQRAREAPREPISASRRPRAVTVRPPSLRCRSPVAVLRRSTTQSRSRWQEAPATPSPS